MTNLPTLDRVLLRDPPAGPASLPDARLLELPEKAVQFGTGALLRGFIDYFIDAANRSGRFHGRIVAVDSTGSGRTALLNAQDGLFTLAVQGREHGAAVQEWRVIASLSRALSARDQWPDVLALARSPHLELIFSNTTEAGIVLDEDDAFDGAPPRSFPGKLTRFLHERARAFDYAPERAPVVVPCELIEQNGPRLREIVRTLGVRWGLGAAFERWLDHVVFCDTLVDRIVPGTPSADVLEVTERELGYRDALLTVCEPYRLFAIAGDAVLRDRLGFADEAEGVIVAPDITPYRERKVRLLNGAHTITAPAALLCGCETVLDAVRHELVGQLVREALLHELPEVTAVPAADEFAAAVLDRFSNPFVRHQLLDITLQQTTKFRVRVVPSILRHAARHGRVPPALTLGMVALLHYLRLDAAPGVTLPADEAGARLRTLWRTFAPQSEAEHQSFAAAVCADAGLWGEALDGIDGFVAAIGAQLFTASRDGFAAVLAAQFATAAR